MWKTAFKKNWGDVVCLSRPYPFKSFKGCLPKILVGSFLNTLTQMSFHFFWISMEDAMETSSEKENLISFSVYNQVNNFVSIYSS